MEAEIKQAYPTAHVALIEGSDGIFDVHLGDDLIYSKEDMFGGRFPAPGFIAELIGFALTI